LACGLWATTLALAQMAAGACAADDGLRRSLTWRPDGAAGRLRIPVKVFGVDQRNEAGAFLNDQERRFYSGVGQVRCLTRNNTVNISTAFHLGSFSTMVSTAHGFYSPGGRSRVKAKDCNVLFYDNGGQPLEIARVARLDIRWDRKGAFNDDTQDLAIIKLKRDSRLPRHYYLYRFGQPLTGPTHVTLVGFHSQIENPTIVRKSPGTAMPAPRGFQHEMDARRNGQPFAHPELMAVADYDSSQGSSGGPVFDDTGRVIGVNKGATDNWSSVFNPYDNYNLVVMFDAQFDADLKRMVERR
jgi:hypothetical protein